MRRIYWDTMLLIYLLEGNARYSARVLEILQVSLMRKDLLFTSFLGLGEVMAGAARTSDRIAGEQILAEMNDVGFSFLPFDKASVDTFAALRAASQVKAPDAINLACAAAAGIDLFLTGDRQLLKLHVPGIHFIADFDTPLL